jgi:tripartite ATP-independent transporter DctM subunit
VSGLRTLPRAAGAGAATILLLAIVAALGLNVVARTFALPVVGAGSAAQWAFAILAFAALPALVCQDDRLGGFATRLVAGFAVGTLVLGMAGAASRVGGVEAVLGWPSAWRYGAAAAFCALGLAAALTGGLARAAATAAGAVVSLAPLPGLPIGVAAAAFLAAVLLRVPVALALVAAVALAPGALSDAALGQTVMRGLRPYVLLAVPMFVLAAALMVAGGVGERILAAARWIARTRRTALGEANVLASLLFGGVSGSSIADAAMGARLMIPAMVAAGYGPGRAGAVTAAAAVLPNVLPPSIALLLAAAATDQSVGALWLGGVGAGFVLSLALWLAVRLTPPDASTPGGAAVAPPPGSDEARGGRDAPEGLRVLAGLAPPLAIAVGVLGGLRLGLVTAVEAGLLAIAIAGGFAVWAKGPGVLLPAVSEAAVQTGRVALLIAAAAPVSFLFATSGLDPAAILPQGPGLLVIVAAAGLCLLIGTVLDVGAAILLVLPVLLPAATAAGYDPVHATLVLTVALLLGGLTPPVGMLVLVVKDVSGAGGVYRAVLPYVAALVLAVGVILVVPALTTGLVRLF